MAEGGGLLNRAQANTDTTKPSLFHAGFLQRAAARSAAAVVPFVAPPHQLASLGMRHCAVPFTRAAIPQPSKTAQAVSAARSGNVQGFWRLTDQLFAAPVAFYRLRPPRAKARCSSAGSTPPKKKAARYPQYAGRPVVDKKCAPPSLAAGDVRSRHLLTASAAHLMRRRRRSMYSISAAKPAPSSSPNAKWTFRKPLDGLQAAAVQYGLIADLGQDKVQRIISEAFAKV